MQYEHMPQFPINFLLGERGGDYQGFAIGLKYHRETQVAPIKGVGPFLSLNCLFALFLC